jgi:electron transfer flavoprotein alpha subunit
MEGCLNIVYAGLSQETEGELSLFRNAALKIKTGNSPKGVWFPGLSTKDLEKITLLSDERAIAGGAELDIRYTESLLNWLARLWTEQEPDLVLFSAPAAEIAVRLGGRLSISCFTEVSALRRESSLLVGRKKVCGSNLDWEFPVVPPAILILDGRPVPTAARGKVRLADSGNVAAIESRPIKIVLPGWLIAYEALEPCRANPMESAPLVFAAGRGLGSGAACERLRHIAARYGAPLAFSRPAALNGWGEIAGIIGQSGIRIRPGLCLALGVSGAAAFMAGIDPASRLIAVNPDKNAPIFRYADLGIIARADEFMTALEECAPQEQDTGL